MYPTTFHPLERTIAPPEGQHEEISGLRVVDGKTEDGQPILVSCWELTPEEKQRIAEDGKVYLVVMGRSQPPVLLTAKREDIGL